MAYINHAFIISKNFQLSIKTLQEKVDRIHEAVVSDDVAGLKQWLDVRQLAVVQDRAGMPPLHKAVLYQHADIVRHLLATYPDAVNVTDNVCRFIYPKLC